MKRFEFGSIYDFTQRVIEVFEDDLSEHYVSVYGKYDFIKQILEYLIGKGYPIANEINLQDYDVDEYGKEFVLYLIDDGINVEKVWHEKDEYHDAGYYYGESSVAFVHDECNAKLLKYIQSNIIFEVNIFDEEDVDITDSYYKADIVTGTLKDNDAATITVKCNLDTDEAMKKIRDMEIHMNHINDIFEKMDMFHKSCPW